jgi:hypothetical protein
MMNDSRTQCSKIVRTELPSRAPSESHVIEESHETEVHVKLLVTMKERETGIVSGEINVSFLVTTKHENILHNPGGWLAGDAREFEGVAVKVDRVNVIARIAKMQAIALAFC